MPASDDLDRFAAISERDVDLIVCMTGAVIPAVWQLFHRCAEPPTTRHSVVDVFGEVDICLDWPRHSVHVENKIAAAFQERQPERYRERSAASDKSVTTVLLAPRKYLESNQTSAAMYDTNVSYEDLEQALATAPSPLANELGVLVRHAIEQHRRGPVKQVSDARTSFFSHFAHHAKQHEHYFAADVERGPTASFLAHTEWDNIRGCSVDLVVKFTRGTIDIEIRQSADRQPQISSQAEAAGLSVRTTSRQTLIVGKKVPPLNPDDPLMAQTDRAAVYLDALDHLRDWWLATGRQILLADSS